MRFSILYLSLLFFGSIFGVALVVIWKRLRVAHSRLHRLQENLSSIEHQLVSISRAACKAEARARLTVEEVNEISCYAQHGEEFFLWEKFGFKRHGVFIEIGAYDGMSLSNSLFFEQIGWQGILVEAHPDLVEKCRINRSKSKVVHAALGEHDGGTATFSMVCGASGLDTLSFVSTSEHHYHRIKSKGGYVKQVKVPSRSLNSVLAEYKITGIDWISIDVEGAELDVLKGAGLEKYKPSLIMVEDNSGGSNVSVPDFLKELGYYRQQTIGCNDIYLRTL